MIAQTSICSDTIPIFWYPTLDSTQDQARRLLADASIPTIFAVATNNQTAGRGRRGHSWKSTRNDLAITLVWQKDIHPDLLPSVNLAVALGVFDYLASLSVPDLAIKWPNDVRVAKYKIAGILSETTGSVSDHKTWLLMGIGINLASQLADFAGLEQAATSVYLLTGQAPNPRQAAAELTDFLLPWLKIWSQDGFPGIYDIFVSRSELQPGDTIIIDQQTCEFQNYGKRGDLVYKTPEQKLHTLWSGEIDII